MMPIYTIYDLVGTLYFLEVKINNFQCFLRKSRKTKKKKQIFVKTIIILLK